MNYCVHCWSTHTLASKVTNREIKKSKFFLNSFDESYLSIVIINKYKWVL